MPWRAAKSSTSWGTILGPKALEDHLVCKSRGARPILWRTHRPGQQRNSQQLARRERRHRRQVLDRIGDELRAGAQRVGEIGEGPFGAAREVIPLMVPIASLSDDTARQRW